MLTVLAYVLTIIAVPLLQALFVIPGRLLEGILMAAVAKTRVSTMYRDHPELVDLDSGAQQSFLLQYMREKNIPLIRASMAIAGVAAGIACAYAVEFIFRKFSVAPSWIIVTIILVIILLPTPKGGFFFHKKRHKVLLIVFYFFSNRQLIPPIDLRPSSYSWRKMMNSVLSPKFF